MTPPIEPVRPGRRPALPVVPDAIVAYINARLPKTHDSEAVTITVSELKQEALRSRLAWNDLYVSSISVLYETYGWSISYPGNFADHVPVQSIRFWSTGV